MHATKPRTTERYTGTTVRLTEWHLNIATRNFDEYLDDMSINIDDIDALDAGMVMALRHNYTPADFSQDDF